MYLTPFSSGDFIHTRCERKKENFHSAFCLNVKKSKNFMMMSWIKMKAKLFHNTLRKKKYRGDFFLLSFNKRKLIHVCFSIFSPNRMICVFAFRKSPTRIKEKSMCVRMKK